MKFFTSLCLAALFAAALAQNITVSPAHPECTQCMSNNCCGSDSTCNGNRIQQVCCPNGSAYCGCISSRGFCSGSVYGEGASTGSCFDPSLGSCTYDPTPNLFVVCPNTYSACPSNSFLSCCSAEQTCFTNAGASYPVCAAPTGGPSVIFPTPGSTLYYGTKYTFTYTPAVAGDASYSIIYGGNNQVFGTGTVLENGNVQLQYTPTSFSNTPQMVNLTFVEGNVSTTVQLFFDVAAPPTPSTVADNGGNSAIDTADCLPNGCAGGALCCGGQCYSTGQYKCIQASFGYQLCEVPQALCGRACYDPAHYDCINDSLGPYKA